MTAALAQPAKRLADPVEVFIARCDARAMLYAACELELHEAVDVLQAAAVATGVVDSIGQDEVQRIMADAFAPVRAADEAAGARYELALEQIAESWFEQPPESKGAPDEYSGLSYSFACACRLSDAAYLVKQGDSERLDRWLWERTECERAGIIAHLRNSDQ
jgi:hypothetical protein